MSRSVYRRRSRQDPLGSEEPGRRLFPETFTLGDETPGLNLRETPRRGQGLRQFRPGGRGQPPARGTLSAPLRQIGPAFTAVPGQLRVQGVIKVERHQNEPPIVPGSATSEPAACGAFTLNWAPTPVGATRSGPRTGTPLGALGPRWPASAGDAAAAAGMCSTTACPAWSW